VKIIFAAPKFDRATEYSYEWCLELQQYARSLGHELVILNIEDAVKEKVEAALTNHPSACFCFYDHGNESCLWGNDDEHIIDLSNNNLFKNRDVYTMACLSAKKLGADSYLRYKTVFWGSYDLISFTTDALPLFKKALNYGMTLRLDGETDWNNIMDKTLLHDDEVIDEMMGQGKFFAAALMLQNRNARRVWTDKTPPNDQPSDCKFRRLALKLFGQRGWRIPNPLRLLCVSSISPTLQC